MSGNSHLTAYSRSFGKLVLNSKYPRAAVQHFVSLFFARTNGEFKVNSQLQDDLQQKQKELDELRKEVETQKEKNNVSISWSIFKKLTCTIEVQSTGTAVRRCDVLKKITGITLIILKLYQTRQSSCVTARGVPPAPPTSKSFQSVCPIFLSIFCPFFLYIIIFCPFFVGGGLGGGGSGAWGDGGQARGGVVPTLPMHCGIGPPPPRGQTHKVKT